MQNSQHSVILILTRDFIRIYKIFSLFPSDCIIPYTESFEQLDQMYRWLRDRFLLSDTIESLQRFPDTVDFIKSVNQILNQDILSLKCKDFISTLNILTFPLSELYSTAISIGNKYTDDDNTLLETLSLNTSYKELKQYLTQEGVIDNPVSQLLLREKLLDEDFQRISEEFLSDRQKGMKKIQQEIAPKIERIKIENGNFIFKGKQIAFSPRISTFLEEFLDLRKGIDGSASLDEVL